MEDRPSSFTLDNQTVASNPGGLRVNLLKYARSYPLWPAVLTLGLVGCLAAAPFIRQTGAAVGALVAAVVVNFIYWKRIREHFYYGCVCPAVVVSDCPFLVAVSTDLSTGLGEYVVNCASADEADIRRVRESITDEEWQELKRGLAQVPRPFKRGLYPVRPE